MDGTTFEFENHTLPDWVPENIQNYLLHTVLGWPIRELARQHGVHASTILRQVRRVEARRDDPVVDAGVQMLGVDLGRVLDDDVSALAPDDATLSEQAMRVLRRLSESGAVLAVAEGLDNAIVMRGSDDGTGTRTAVVASSVTQAMALCDWIAVSAPGKVSRYRITAAGRVALSQIIAQSENRARNAREGGFAEAQLPFSTARDEDGSDHPARRVRYGVVESPLVALARRRDKSGKRFLENELVRAGERLREDFELAQSGAGVPANWDKLLVSGTDEASGPVGALRGPAAARRRVAEAMQDLGPGLADVALRCCCYLEGLEVTEKRMGWSARSGKIVLRIALQRLCRHYGDQARSGADMIG